MNEIDIIKEKNFKFNKNFGQNFIFDKNLLTAIVTDSGICKNDEVLEIGPGAGTLTRAIASVAKKVLCYEIDTNLKPILEENLKNLNNVEVIFSDALKTDLAQIESHFEGEYKLIANLPYYITTPLVFKFVGKTDKLKSLTIMVQKEVAERLIASPKKGDYGTISVILDYYGDVKILRNVPRYMFTPSPNVDSSLVQIELRKKYECNDILFEKIVKAAFSNKRKTLVNNLSVSFSIKKDEIASMLKSLNLDEKVRGDSLTVQNYVDISNFFDKNLLNNK